MGDEFLKGLGADIHRAFTDNDVSTDGLQMLQFEALLESEQQSQKVASAFGAIGLTPKVGQADDDQWLCSGTAPFEIDVARLNELGARLQVIIEKDNKGQFNGWSLVARWADLRNPKAPAMSIGQMRGKVDESKFPHTVIARVLDTTEPVDRGAKYDDKLDAALAKSGTGAMLAAGSVLSDGNVTSLRFEFRLGDDKSAVDSLKRALLDCGAPRGSWIEVAGDEVPLYDDTAELLSRSRRKAPVLTAPPPGEAPAGAWFFVEGESEGKPEVWMINGGILDLKSRESFPWHLSLICELKDTLDNGLPTPEENQAFKPIGELFDANIAKDNNAVPLARITWDGAKQYLYRVADPELPHQWLQSVIAAGTEPRPFDYRMDNDPEWELASQHLALSAKARETDRSTQ